MDGNVLNELVLLFKQASLIWAPVVAQIMEPMLIALILIAWVFAFLGPAFAPGIDFFPILFRFFILNGLALAAVRFGAAWVNDLFEGVAQVAYRMGVPPLNPSAVLAMGPVVADPIMKALAEQGMLSYFTNPLTYSFMFGSFALMLAFFVLAFVLTSILIFSFLLTAACPFFCAFAGVGFTRGITLGYVRMVFGTMSTLFIVALMTAIMSELAAIMEQWLRTQLLVEGVTLTWADMIGPIGVGIVLIGLFIWIPFKVAREVDGVVMDWSGGRQFAGYATGGLSMLTAGAQAAGHKLSGNSNAGSLGNNSSGSQMGGSSSGGGGSRAKVPAQSSWGGKTWK